ncbi:MAG: hypothetical protein ABI670_20015 [Chloroflexota bacterium]
MDTKVVVSSSLRGAFMVAAVLLLVAGLYLFIFAESVATLPAAGRSGNAWPWPIGPLALRFIASLVLSAVVACFLVVRRPDRVTVAAFASVAAIVSAMLLIHFLANLGVIDWSKPLSIVWPTILLLGLAGGVLLLVRMRRNTVFTVPPLPPTPGIARYIAIFIFSLTGIVGAAMFFLPNFSRDRWPWDLANSTNVQLLGAVFLSVSLSSLLSWLQPSWYGFDIFYPTAGTFATVALVASFIHWNLFSARPITSIVFVAIYILGAILGYYPYFRYALRSDNKLRMQTS